MEAHNRRRSSGAFHSFSDLDSSTASINGYPQLVLIARIVQLCAQVVVSFVGLIAVDVHYLRFPVHVPWGPPTDNDLVQGGGKGLLWAQHEMHIDVGYSCELNVPETVRWKLVESRPIIEPVVSWNVKTAAGFSGTRHALYIPDAIAPGPTDALVATTATIRHIACSVGRSSVAAGRFRRSHDATSSTVARVAAEIVAAAAAAGRALGTLVAADTAVACVAAEIGAGATAAGRSGRTLIAADTAIGRVAAEIGAAAAAAGRSQRTLLAGSEVDTCSVGAGPSCITLLATDATIARVIRGVGGHPTAALLSRGYLIAAGSTVASVARGIFTAPIAAGRSRRTLVAAGATVVVVTFSVGGAPIAAVGRSRRKLVATGTAIYGVAAGVLAPAVAAGVPCGAPIPTDTAISGISFVVSAISITAATCTGLRALHATDTTVVSISGQGSNKLLALGAIPALLRWALTSTIYA